MPKSIRILSATGPGDVVRDFNDWQAGVHAINETTITYSSQEFNFFDKHSIPFWVISSNARRDRTLKGMNRVENRPRLLHRPSSALGYHLAQVLYAFSLLSSAVRFRATHAIVDSGTAHWFVLVAFRFFGVQVLPNFHNSYWPAGHPPRGATRRTILTLDKAFFRWFVKAAFGVSPECGRQVAQLSSGRTTFFDYRGQFPGEEFLGIPRPLPPKRHVQVMFAGRIEASKGVFDLLRMCEILSVNAEREFHFEVCGAGSALERLAAAAELRQLGSRFVLRGKLGRKDLLAAYARSHVVVVPTRSETVEGFAMVCAEAVLAGRPFITSRLVPALEVLRACAVEANEDDPEDYAQKILLLSTDPDRFNALVASTQECGRQFVDGVLGLEAALENCLLPKGGSESA